MSRLYLQKMKVMNIKMPGQTPGRNKFFLTNVSSSIQATKMTNLESEPAPYSNTPRS